MVDPVALGPAPPRSRLTANTVGMLAARVVLAGAGLVTVPVLYDRLGAQRFGVWMVLSGMLGTLTLVDLGLGSALVREVARAVAGESRDRLDAVLGLGLAWGLGLGLCALAAVTLCWPLLGRLLHVGGMAVEAWHGAMWLCVGVLAAGVELPWRAVLEGSQRYGLVSLISAGTALGGAGAAV
ncbi:MAG TPA: hypothetical protein VJT31_09310, partial [Rugosimonospora sp.]|nr:hypothetical protein [Rugosimonospora sp.]